MVAVFTATFLNYITKLLPDPTPIEGYCMLYLAIGVLHSLGAAGIMDEDEISVYGVE